MSFDADSNRLALPAGYQLEEYRIESILGKGGFGITYLARDTRLQHRVAIKEMLPDGIATRVGGQTVVAQTKALEDNFRWALARFTDEARVLASLSHPNIVPVLRLIESNGTAYMVMAFVEGDSLTQWYLKHPKPSEEELKSVLMPLLDGVEYLHKRKLIHRDIKPDNVFLTTGEAKPMLLDFGNVRQEVGRTMTMTTVVSDGYSPFEQYQQRANQGAFTDIYALAAVMARGITGQKIPNAPDRVSDEDVFEPLAKSAQGRYSTAFLEALDRALSVWSRDRPQSVAEFRALLSGVARPANQGAVPQAKRSSVDEEKTRAAAAAVRGEGNAAPPAKLGALWKILGGAAGVGVMGLIIYLSSPKPDPGPEINPAHDTIPAKGTSGTGKKIEAAASKEQPSAEKKIEPDKSKMARTWVVDAKPGAVSDGPDLGAVIAKANAGDTITVKAGIYDGAFTLTKPVKIVGDPAGGQPIVSAESSSCFAVQSRGVAFENLQIQNRSRDSSSTTPAVTVAGDGELRIDGCRIRSGSKLGLACAGTATITAAKCVFEDNAGAAFQLGEQSHGQLTDCQFIGNVAAVIALGEAGADLKNCTFQGNGSPKGKGIVIGVSGEKARVGADNCTFTRNQLGLEAAAMGSLVLTQCMLSDNGIEGDLGSAPAGLVAASDGGHVTLGGVTFKSNHQGVVASGSGILEMTDCHFTGNGMETKSARQIPCCQNVTVSGAGSTASVLHCDFAEAQMHAVYVIDGGSADIEDTSISASKKTGIVVGLAEKKAGHADVRRCHVNGNASGIVVVAGSSAGIEDTECRENGAGLTAQDAGTRMQLKKVTASDNHELALWSHSSADVTAVDCILENNGQGAQSGGPDKGSLHATLTLENSRIGPNKTFDALCCQQSTLTLKNWTFGAEGKPKIMKERNATVNVEPEVEIVAKKPSPTLASHDDDDDDAPAKKGKSSQKSGSSGRGSSSNPPEVIRKTLDGINRLKHIFR